MATSPVSNIGYCKDCDHWTEHTNQYRESWIECGLAEWYDRKGVLHDDLFGYYAQSDDDSGLDAGIKTGPMFGCVKFRSKE
jgi:hypothetical protein